MMEFLRREAGSLNVSVGEMVKEEVVVHNLALRGDILLEDRSSNSLVEFNN